MVTQTTGTQGASYQQPAPTTKTKDTDQLASKDTFMQLLVAQIKNQNPLSPTDGVQFLSQLAQFTQVEQSTQMRDELKSIHELLSQAQADKANSDNKKTDGTTGIK